MKYIAPFLLISYAAYSATLPNINIAHSIIMFSLAALFAWNQHILSKHTPKLEEEVAKLKSELEQQLGKLKESHGRKIAELEGEVQKMSFNAIKNASPSSSSPRAPEKKAYQF